MMNRLLGIIEEDAARTCSRVLLEELANKRVLLTGATGLLGLHFLATLRHLNSELNVPVSIYAITHSKISPLFKKLTDNSWTQVIHGDLSDIDFIRSLPKFDCVIHAAGYGQPSKFALDPVRTLELNTIGTFGLLRLLNPNGRFLFTSSAEVYTGLTKTPFSEEEIGTTNTTHARSCYIEGKRSGEAICNAFRTRGVDAKSARIALTYGPGTHRGDSRVLNMLIEKALCGEIQLMDQGDAKRSFLYVSDAVEMMFNILLRGTKPIYNVGGEFEISVLSLAQEIGKLVHVPVFQGQSSSGMPGAPATVMLDSSRYAQEFQRTPGIALEEGLARTIEWQRELYKN